MGRVQDTVFASVAALDRILYNCSSIPFKDYCNATEITGYDLFEVMGAFSTVGTDGVISFTGVDRTSKRASPFWMLLLFSLLLMGLRRCVDSSRYND